ncbi:MAG: acyl-CoA dehydrogenase family protein [Acidobacteriota bacterium]
MHETPTLSYAFGKNHWDLEPDLPLILEALLPGWHGFEGVLSAFGAKCGAEVAEAGYHTDHEARPVLVAHDLDGRRIDRVRLNPSQARLLPELAFVNRPPFEGRSWLEHYALGFLLADPGLYCLLTITGQTAYALHKYAPGQKAWEEKLLSGEAWGATWMTENQGGSDLGANQTVARRDGEGWRLTGEKYFASGAGLADAALVTARPAGAPPGPKGLALFLVPRLNRAGELNFFVRRLKDKSATRSVPSGEVELAGSEAVLIGEAQEGIYYTLETLTVSRLANAVAAMGIARKAHLEAALRSRRRHSFGRALAEHPLVRRDLVEMEVRMAGGLALALFAARAFDRAWLERPPYSRAYHAARFLTHLAKNRTADHASAITQTAMELFGGLGFLEEYAVARWHREALITPIWEGPSNIQALDLLESMTKKRAHESFLEEMLPRLERAGEEPARMARRALEDTVGHLSALPPDEAQWYAKEGVARLADAAQVALLYDMAAVGGERFAKLARLYAERFIRREEFPAWALTEEDLWSWEALRRA